jgi:hypothetical protein
MTDPTEHLPWVPVVLAEPVLCWQYPSTTTNIGGVSVIGTVDYIVCPVSWSIPTEKGKRTGKDQTTFIQRLRTTASLIDSLYNIYTVSGTGAVPDTAAMNGAT